MANLEPLAAAQSTALFLMLWQWAPFQSQSATLMIVSFRKAAGAFLVLLPEVSLHG